MRWIAIGILVGMVWASSRVAMAEDTYIVGSGQTANGTTIFDTLDDWYTYVYANYGVDNWVEFPDAVKVYVYTDDNSLPTSDPVQIWGYDNVSFIKTGSGTWKSDAQYLVGASGSNALVIDQGKLNPRENFLWYSTGSLQVNENAVFRPTITSGDLVLHVGDDSFQAQASRFFVSSFASQEGASLEVSGISSLPALDSMSVEWASYGIVILDSGGSAAIASTLRVENDLMTAYLEEGTRTINGSESPAVVLTVDRVAPLTSLCGVGDGADIFRRRIDLTWPERDMLDDIYNRGGASDPDLAFLQTINGDAIMLAQVAMRTNLSNVIKNVSRRTTGLQKEELVRITSEKGIPPVEPLLVCYDEWWAFADAAYAIQRDVGNQAGYDYLPYGIGVGYETHRDQWIAGGVLRIDNGAVRLRHGSSTRSDVTSLIAGLYGSYSNPDGYYFTGGVQAGLGWNRHKSVYDMPGLSITAKGDSTSMFYGANVEVGWMASFGDPHNPTAITPYLGVSYANIQRTAFDEGGGGNLDRHFARSRWNSAEAVLGMRVAKTIVCDKYTLIPALDVAFAHTYGSPGNSGVDAFFVDSPDSAWRIDTVSENRNALRLGASLNAVVKDNLTVGVAYDFELRNRYFSNQLNFNLTKGF